MPRQVKETESFHLAIMAKQDDETQEHVMALLPTVEHSGSTRMRTLGFVGPFLAQYEAAQVDCQVWKPRTLSGRPVDLRLTAAACHLPRCMPRGTTAGAHAAHICIAPLSGATPLHLSRWRVRAGAAVPPAGLHSAQPHTPAPRCGGAPLGAAPQRRFLHAAPARLTAAHGWVKTHGARLASAAGEPAPAQAVCTPACTTSHLASLPSPAPLKLSTCACPSLSPSRGGASQRLAACRSGGRTRRTGPHSRPARHRQIHNHLPPDRCPGAA